VYRSKPSVACAKWKGSASLRLVRGDGSFNRKHRVGPERQNAPTLMPTHTCRHKQLRERERETESQCVCVLSTICVKVCGCVYVNSPMMCVRAFSLHVCAFS